MPLGGKDFLRIHRTLKKFNEIYQSHFATYWSALFDLSDVGSFYSQGYSRSRKIPNYYHSLLQGCNGNDLFNFHNILFLLASFSFPCHVPLTYAFVISLHLFVFLI